jgi:hypothetical protein
MIEVVMNMIVMIEVVMMKINTIIRMMVMVSSLT